MIEHRQNFVGRSVPRLEDRPLLLGRAASPPTSRFPASGICASCARPLRTAQIKAIDASARWRLPGVHAVWTADDVAHIPPIPFRLTGLTELEPYRQPVLAKDVVRYVGEPAAVVFAEDAYAAEDAADLVELTIEQQNIALNATEQPGSTSMTAAS